MMLCRRTQRDFPDSVVEYLTNMQCRRHQTLVMGMSCMLTTWHCAGMKGLASRSSGKYLASSKSSPNLQGPPRADTLCVLGKECRSRRRLATADNDASGPPAPSADLKGVHRPSFLVYLADLADLKSLHRARHYVSA